MDSIRPIDLPAKLIICICSLHTESPTDTIYNVVRVPDRDEIIIINGFHNSAGGIDERILLGNVSYQ